jgi:UDP-N-acetylglucosamine acyltransferase
MTIHPSAIVSSKAEIAESAEIGPFCVIGDNVKVGSNSVIGTHTVIEGDTQIGENCYIVHASIGLPPQDLICKGENTKVRIGNNVTIREFVTIHRGSEKGRGETTIKDGAFLMNYVHIGHDCMIDEEVIIANGTNLAGHVHIHRKANLSALFLAHQYTEVGELAMLSGMSGARKSVPPFVIAEGRPARIMRVNSIGLERAGFSTETIKEIGNAYRILKKEDTKEVLRKLEEKSSDFPELMKIVDFYRNSQRGVIAFYSTKQEHS